MYKDADKKKKSISKKESRIYSDRMRSADRGGSLWSGNMEKQTASPHLKKSENSVSMDQQEDGITYKGKLILITTI